MNNFFELLDDFVEDLYADGTVDRWKREKEGRKRPEPRPRYDRAAVMRSAWKYRKTEGFTMSAALKLAWADARRSTLHLVA
jgi:hypothetical protein